MRRLPVILLALLAVLASLAPHATRALDAPEGVQHWSIWRRGERVGRYNISFHRDDGGTLVVQNEIDITIALLVVPIYRYVHRDREVWRDGSLVELTADTNNDGKARSVDAEATSAGLAVDGPAGKFVAPAGTVPSSLWSIEMTRAPAVLDAESGRQLAVQFTMGAEEPVPLAGLDVRARHVSMTGEIMRELWYGPNGLLVRLQFTDAKGAVLDFRRETP